MPNVTVQTATPPEGTCPPWIIELWPQLVGLLTANLNGALNVFNYGSSTPAPADQDKPWLKLDASGFPDGQYWVFRDGFWLKRHPLVPGIGALWWGDSTAIDTFDGGEAGDPLQKTGRMWEIVTALTGRFPIGAGNLPSPSTTVLAVGASGGEENHTLVLSEMTPHDHEVFAQGRPTDGGSTVERLAPSVDIDFSYASTGETGGGQPHNNMPPYSALHFIRRSTRLFYRA